MEFHVSSNLVHCPECNTKVRVDRLDGHRRAKHGWRTEAEIKIAKELLLTKKKAAIELGKKVAENEKLIRDVHRFKAAQYRLAEKARRLWAQKTIKKQKKPKRNAWPDSASLSKGSSKLVYAGAFEMNRRKH